MSIPTLGLTPTEVSDLVSWLRVESVVRRSRLTSAEAMRLADEVKSDWWQANRDRYTGGATE